MKISRCVLIFMGMILFCTAFGQIKIDWAKDLYQATLKAKKAQKLVMMSFKIKGNEAYTRQLETYNDPAVAKLINNFVPIELDLLDTGKKSSMKYNVFDIPTIVFIDPSGSLIGKIEGFSDAKRFIEETNRILESFRALPKLLKSYKEKPDDLIILGKIIDTYADRDHEKYLLKYIEEAEKLDPKNEKDVLSKGYITLGVIYANQDKPELSEPWFYKTATTAKDLARASKGRFYYAAVLGMQGKLEECKRELEILINTKDAPNELVEEAKLALKWVEDSMNSESDSSKEEESTENAE